MKTERSYIKARKDALNHLARSVEGTNCAFSIAVYTALRLKADDGRTPEGPISLPVAAIAQAAGLGYRKTFEVIQLLERLGVIRIGRRQIENTKAHAPSVFTFCAIDSTPSAQCAEDLMHGTKVNPCRDSEETRETDEPIAPGMAGAPVSDASKAHQKDELFEELCRLQGFNYRMLPKDGAERGRINKALKDIRNACPDATVTMLEAATERHRRKYKDAPHTAPAIAGRWLELTAGMTPGAKILDDDQRQQARIQRAQLNSDLAALLKYPPCDDSVVMQTRQEGIATLEAKIARLEGKT